jgi:redox-sensitive bicupin YhaK (pirin superfamily)
LATTLDYPFDAGRQGYLHLARGRLRVGDITLSEGDDLRVQQQGRLALVGLDEAEVLLFDLPETHPGP